MSDLAALAKPFQSKDVQSKPGKGGGDYVKHSTVTEKLLATVGPFSTRVDQVIYDGGEVTGVLLTLVLHVDGRLVEITEAGDNENPTATTNGARLKDCMSDALKRCAMRVGCGLHLWSQDSYRLDRALRNKDVTESPASDSESNCVASSSAGTVGDPGTGKAVVPAVESVPEPLPRPGGDDIRKASGKPVVGVVRETELAVGAASDDALAAGEGPPASPAVNPVKEARKAAAK